MTRWNTRLIVGVTVAGCRIVRFIIWHLLGLTGQTPIVVA